MADLLTRVTPDLEIRSDGTGRTLYGLLVPFGPVAEVADGGGRPYRERFVAGSCQRTASERQDKVRLLVNHDARRLPIGRFTLLREDPAGLYGEAKVSKTTAGDEVLELARDGAVSFSVGFRGVRERMADDGVLERTEIALRECSVTGTPAYEDALVAGVRSLSAPTLSPEAARLRLLELSK